MSKYLEESYDEALKENERLKFKLRIAINELNKIYSLANGVGANEMFIRQKAEETLNMIKDEALN